jgi:hypothetical protein
MWAFKVEVNGKRVCVAGVGANGVLSAITDFVGSPVRGSNLDLSVRGLFTQTGEHATWARIGLKVGDRIVLKVIETDSVDKPREFYLPDSKTDKRNQKAYVRALAKNFGWKLITRPRQKIKAAHYQVSGCPADGPTFETPRLISATSPVAPPAERAFPLGR